MDITPTVSTSVSSISINDEACAPSPGSDKKKLPIWGYAVFFLLGLGAVMGMFMFIAALDFYKK